MNPVQLEAMARQILPIIGTLLATIGFKNATTYVDTVLQVIGPLITIGSVIWSFVANKTSAVISKAANLPEVKDITLAPSAPPDVVAATPNNVTK